MVLRAAGTCLYRANDPDGNRIDAMLGELRNLLRPRRRHNQIVPLTSGRFTEAARIAQNAWLAG